MTSEERWAQYDEKGNLVRSSPMPKTTPRRKLLEEMIYAIENHPVKDIYGIKFVLSDIAGVDTFNWGYHPLIKGIAETILRYYPEVLNDYDAPATWRIFPDSQNRYHWEVIGLFNKSMKYKTEEHAFILKKLLEELLNRKWRPETDSIYYY